MNGTTARLTLRDLPLSAKMVITCFLISVGLGYCWALMQLHFKHASKGNLVPTPADTVARFSGKPWPLDGPEEKPPPAPANPFGKFAKDPAKIKTLITERCAVCHSEDGGEEPHLDSFAKLADYLQPKNGGKGKIHKLITAADDAPWGKDGSMRLAFTEKSYIANNEWKKEFPKLAPEKQKELLAEREAERQVLIAWIEAGATKESYEKDSFKLPEAPPAPAVETRESKAKKRQLDVDALTQSTHAHLLTFSLLWAATGLVFAFTSYPGFIRFFIAPLVLIFQVLDIACWWLARLPDVGPYFALAIMGTGAIVGLGLALQIVLSLFNMYGWKGKILLFLLLLGAGGGGGLVYIKYVAPMVADEKAAVAKP